MTKLKRILPTSHHCVPLVGVLFAYANSTFSSRCCTKGTTPADFLHSGTYGGLLAESVHVSSVLSQALSLILANSSLLGIGGDSGCLFTNLVMKCSAACGRNCGTMWPLPWNVAKVRLFAYSTTSPPNWTPVPMKRKWGVLVRFASIPNFRDRVRKSQKT